EMRAEIEVVGAKAKRGAEDDLVEHGSGGIDDQLAALCGADDAVKVAGVDGGHGDGGLFAKKTAGACGIAVAAPDVVALAFQKLCEERTSGPRSQNEDAHDFSKLYHSPRGSGAPKASRGCGN